MAITVTERSVGFRAGAVDETGAITYTRQYKIQSDPATEITDQAALDALTTNGFLIHSEHPTHVHAKLISIQCSEVEAKNRSVYFVTLTWSTAPPAGRIEVPEHNPVDEPAEIVFGGIQTTRVLEKDMVNGTAVVNSLGLPFDPPVTLDDSRTSVTIILNKASPLSLSWVDRYRGTVNSEAYDLLGYLVAPKETRLANLVGQLLWYNGHAYWRVTFEIHFADYGSTYNPIELLDEGLCKRVGEGADAVIKPITVPISGDYYQQKMPLNGAGNALTAQQIAAGQYHWLQFDGYREEDFAGLGLPTGL